MKLFNLAPNARRASEILRSVAEARGCRTDAEIEAFLAPLPALPNTFRSSIGDYQSALGRIAKALASRETIAIYGDFDADGICSTVQMVRFLRVAGANVRWFVPNRSTNAGGFTIAGTARCVATHRPSLIIAVDCGSNCRTEVLTLAKQGIDTIVLDHHSLTIASPGAVAHLNPQAYPAAIDLQKLCAAGLTYLWCEAMAQDLGINRNWERCREGNLILAGLGTVADSVPLLGLNRALFKHAVALAKQPIILERTPGLVALSERGFHGLVSFRSFTHEWTPRLNACGRMGDASSAIQMLLSSTLEEARPFAEACDQANTERRTAQERVRVSAAEMAEQLIQRDPGARVLVLANPDWHVGVLSGVATTIREQFRRPVILLGWSDDLGNADVVGHWVGSGRSYDVIDLCPIVNDAVLQGLVISGGGHPAAVGVRIAADKLEAFGEYLKQAVSGVPLSSFQDTFEILGNADDLPPESWLRVMERLAPFGNGNPQPYLAARRAQLAQPPCARRTREAVSRVFAMSGLFRRANMPPEASLLQFNWHDPQRANDVWFQGRSYDVLLTVAQRKNPSLATPEPLFDWRVAHCEPAA